VLTLVGAIETECNWLFRAVGDGAGRFWLDLSRVFTTVQDDLDLITLAPLGLHDVGHSQRRFPGRNPVDVAGAGVCLHAGHRGFAGLPSVGTNAMAISGDSVRTLLDALRAHADGQPDRVAFTYLAGGEIPTDTLTYGDLDARSRAVASQLAERWPPKERVLLVCDSDMSFILGFFSCLYAGLVAVPVPPPHPRRDSGRLVGVAADCRPAGVLTTRPLLPRVVGSVADLPVQILEDLPDCAGAGHRLPDVTLDSLAFLQYTSGSTSVPRGVRVRHSQLVANQEVIRAKFSHDAETVVVGWLPLHHDMGLIGNVLQTVYLGSRAVLMPPAAFIQQPGRWLRAISRYSGTTAGGPNFAYDLCVRRTTPDERGALDLSSWRVAFNGAEPVRETTLTAFSSAFAGCGFRDTSFYPCYGLAEATLFLTGGQAGHPRSVCHVGRRAIEKGSVVITSSEDPDGVALVGCGGPAADHSVTVWNPETSTSCGPDAIGEVCARGPSVADGYWGREQETEATFVPPGPTLRTGDLGFIRDGQLYLVGRLKDLIIIHGINHHPEDIESTVTGSHPMLHNFRGVAVQLVEDGGCVVIHEVGFRVTAAECPPVAAAIRAAVAATHGVSVSTVVLLRPGSLPVTTSGKPRRKTSSRWLQDGSLAGIIFLHTG
jgi:acyl-CoA synthetase (AMP-forming)/AMP-acid ligase II